MTKPFTGAVLLTPGAALGLTDPTKAPEDGRLTGFIGSWPKNPSQVPIASWDTGVFVTELMNLSVLPAKRKDLTSEEAEIVRANPEVLAEITKAQAPSPLEEGTYRGTQLALTKIYEMIERRFSSFMDAGNFEPVIPSRMPLEKKKQYYMFTDPADDKFPPHLNVAASAKTTDILGKDAKNQQTTLGPADLFDKMRLAQLTNLLPTLIPKNFLLKGLAKVGQADAYLRFGEMGRPDAGESIADIEKYNREQRSKSGGFFDRNDIFNLPNIGDLPDWYSDERFGQQFFTGTNPTTLELATDFWIKHFIDNATEDYEHAMKEKIIRLSETEKSRLYMQDYSYFRKAAGLGESDSIAYDVPQSDLPKGSGPVTRHGVASVCLFHFDSKGKLNPLAIVIDWRGSAQNSVTIYNKELPFEKQGTDWPWRYAKTCVQVSDWVRHEVTVHLTNTHLIEESTIVAAQRSFENNHPVLQVLYPHWQKTLSLNAAARLTLVPHVITDIIGFSKDQAYAFIRSEYETFDFKGRYVPKDLKRRGFDPSKLDKDFKNYAYARCIHSMWWKIHKYVKAMLGLYYKSDKDVADDESIRNWYEIMQAPAARDRGGAALKSFPTIETFDELVDAVTMCIHIASPQHTAVNYLQNYYQAFVINKPPCLYAAPPKSKAELRKFDESDLVLALPINHTREWLLASHIPYLLSFKPGDKESLIIYAASKWHLYKGKRPTQEDPYPEEIRDIAARFYEELAESEAEFKRYGAETFDADKITYDVLSPSWNAVSILI